MHVYINTIHFTLWFFFEIINCEIMILISRIARAMHKNLPAIAHNNHSHKRKGTFTIAIGVYQLMIGPHPED